jgi:precorrin-3B synthase
MSGGVVKGWCPDAWRPMMAGDGLLVRVKPRLGRLSRAQVLGLCDAAIAFGHGLIDLTSRANLQIRGVGEGDWPQLLAALIDLGLVDTDPATEKKRNIVVAPDWEEGDDSHRIATELLARLDRVPELPSKAGLVVDAGLSPTLAGIAGDFRVERCTTGGLILRADGRETGVELARGQEADALVALARWFAESGGATAGRMARHRAALPAWASGATPPALAAPGIAPGPHRLGAAYGLPFGHIEARALRSLVDAPHVHTVRITPWRIILVEGAAVAAGEGLLVSPVDPLLRADACPGAPFCPQATVSTRDLARALAPFVAGRLHVSGCAKGCARPQATDVTLTGRDGLFDLAFDACAGSSAVRASLEPRDVLAHFGAA